MRLFRSSPLPKSSDAFSLVELLTVIAIIAVLASLTILATGALSSSRLTTTALDIRTAGELARQKAVTSGKPVELRFYKLDGSTGDYSAFRIVAINGTNEVKLKFHRLPDGIVMKNSPLGSTILNQAPLTNEAVSGFVAGDTRRIRFLPNGSIEGLSPASPQTLTLAVATDATTTNSLPANFATVSFDVVLGSSAIYRP